MAKLLNYLLLGEDLVLKREFLTKFLASKGIANKRESERVIEYYASEIDANTIFSEAQTYPFFGTDKIIIVSEAEKINLKDLKNYFNDPLKSTILIFQSEQSTTKFSKATQKIFEKQGEVKMFWPLFEDKLKIWAERKAKNEYKLSYPNKFGDFLIDISGRNSKIVEKNLQLLSNNFEENNFSLEDAVAAVLEKKGVDIFSFIDVLFARKLKKSLLYFRELLFEGEDMVGMQFLIQRQLRFLWEVKVGKKSNPFQFGGKMIFNKLSSQSRLWDFNELASAIRLFAVLDKMLKSNPKNICRIKFERIIYQICRNKF